MYEIMTLVLSPPTNNGTVFRQVLIQPLIVTRKKPYKSSHSLKFEGKGLSSEERWHQIIWFSARKDFGPGYFYYGLWQSKAAAATTTASP